MGAALAGRSKRPALSGSCRAQGTAVLGAEGLSRHSAAIQRRTYVFCASGSQRIKPQRQRLFFTTSRHLVTRLQSSPSDLVGLRSLHRSMSQTVESLPAPVGIKTGGNAAAPAPDNAAGTPPPLPVFSSICVRPGRATACMGNVVVTKENIIRALERKLEAQQTRRTWSWSCLPHLCTGLHSL